MKARVGGHFLHDRCNFEVLGTGVSFPPQIARTQTLWFEGPLIRQPASQQAEDYPQDYAADLTIESGATPGLRWWRCWNAQGVTPPLGFVVGDLPEVVEEETDGQPIPVSVTLPVTINGRIFPREDIDIWTFAAEAGQTVTCAVSAREFGSPLAARLWVRDESGKLLAESTGDALGDAKLRFVAPASGRYQLHIQDVAAGGLQHYVYRLTVTSGPWIDHVYPLGGRGGSKVNLELDGGRHIAWDLPDIDPGIIHLPLSVEGRPANAVRLDIGDLAEHVEAEPNEAAQAAQSVVAVPAMLNGRIQVPQDIDLWPLALSKGQPVLLDARVTRLGSPLAIVMTLRDSAGKQVAQVDGSTAAGDVSLAFNPPADGTYMLEVTERFARRGGPSFSYRIQVAPPKPDFQLFAPDFAAVDVGGEKKIDVLIERQGDFKAPITLQAVNLPPGVTCEEVQVAPNANKAALTIKAPAGTPVVSSLLQIVGKSEVDGKLMERVALWAGQKDGFGRGERVPMQLCVTLPTPFKFVGQYSLTYAPRGGVLRKKYAIDRGGYEGPLTAQLAERQGRHLQGVTGPVIEVPPGATEFEYPLSLPPWMELGRTSRTNLMLTGEVKDAAGIVHKVCYTTKEQNEQLIALVSPAPLRLATDRGSYAIQPSGELAIPVAIKRDASVTSPVKLELVVPRHMHDIAAEAVVAAPGQEAPSLVIRMGPTPGPLNMPLVIRATAERPTGEAAGDPLTAETSIELVIPQR